MEYINSKAELIGESDPFKKIERAGRTCYKSESKITEDSAYKFVRGLIKSNHTAMLEHCVLVFEVKGIFAEEYITRLCAESRYVHKTKTFVNGKFRYLVSANVRAVNEGSYYMAALLAAMYEVYPDLVWDFNALDVNPRDLGASVKLVDLREIPDLTEEEIRQHYAVTFKLVTSRGVTHELVRHRPCSFAQESTRYVNYKEGINICLPSYYGEKSPEVQKEYDAAFWDAEKHYCNLIDMGEKPQEARAVLPIELKTEIVVTANMQEWEWILKLRYLGTTGAPHPDIKYVTGFVFEILKEDPIAGKLSIFKK